MTPSSILAVVALAMGTARAQSPVSDRSAPTPTFFITLSSDGCEYNGVKMTSKNLIKQGRLCAYVQETNQLYACPAGADVCWNKGEPCRGGEDKAGQGQDLCTNIGVEDTTWCCNNVSGGCTSRENRTDNCWTGFGNPNRDIEQVFASSAASSAIASASSVTTNLLFVTPLSTGGWALATPTDEAISSTATTGALLPATATGGAGLQSTSVTAAEPSRSGLSAGTIAGIAVGVIFGSIAFTAICLFFHFYGRRRAQATQAGTYRKSHKSQSSWSSWPSRRRSSDNQSTILSEVAAGQHSVAAELSAQTPTGRPSGPPNIFRTRW